MLNFNYLLFSDAAKFADIARNLLINGKPETTFNFWGGNNLLSMKYLTSYLMVIFFKVFGINDFAVVITSFFYFLLSLIFVYLLAQKIYKNKLTSILATVAVGFNYNLINYATSGASESPFIFEILAGTYFLSLKKWWGNVLGVIFMILMYFTRPQAIIYIFGLILYFFINNFSWKKGLIYTFVSFVIGTIFYALFSKQGLIAVTQNLPGMAVSDSLRGGTVDFNLIVLIKKVFYNLYNFYKALPEIINPYLFTLFLIGIIKKNTAFKTSVLFMFLATLFITALTIPFYRYIHPVVPLIYIVAVGTLMEIIDKFKVQNPKFKMGIATGLVMFFAVGQTLGILFLDSRFEKKLKNIGKAPIYVEMSYKLKEITDKDDVIVTNLDTWGSWYGERKTIWFPLEPSMLENAGDEIDAIYLTSYKIDDQNYYMGKNWRILFDNPQNQVILSDFKFAGEYRFNALENFDNEEARAILFVRK